MRALCLALVMIAATPGVHAQFVEKPPRTVEAAPGWYGVRGGAWEADADTVDAMRAGIGQQSSVVLDKYVVQYQGVIEDGKRVVRVAGACHADGNSIDTLTRGFRNIADGGKCFFDATYDPEGKRFTWFAFHGNA